MRKKKKKNRRIGDDGRKRRTIPCTGRVVGADVERALCRIYIYIYIWSLYSDKSSDKVNVPVKKWLFVKISVERLWYTVGDSISLYLHRES